MTLGWFGSTCILECFSIRILGACYFLVIFADFYEFLLISVDFVGVVVDVIGVVIVIVAVAVAVVRCKAIIYI